MNNRINRRNFTTTGLQFATALAIGANPPVGWIQSLAAAITEQPTSQDRVLVVIQLSGGNDGLNSVIPYANELYYKGGPN